MADSDPLADAFTELDGTIADARTPQPPPPRPKPPVLAPKEPSLVDKAVALVTKGGSALDPLAGTKKAIGAAVLRTPGQALGGSLDLLADSGKFIHDNISPAFLRQAPVLDVATSVAGSLKGAAHGASLADVLSMRSTLGSIGNPEVNQFSTEAFATVAPMMGGKAGLVTRIGRAAVGGAIGLPAKDFQGRMINAGVGAAAEVGGELLFAGGKAVLKRVIKNATPKEAAQDALDRAFAQSRTEEARVAQQEASLKEKPVEPTEASEALPEPDRKGDITPDRKLQDDANEALKQAGSAHQVGARPKLSPDGKIIVPDATKAMLDETPHGRAFVGESSVERDAVIFKEEASDGSARVVGSMGREDLVNFGADVAHLRDNPGLIDLKSDSPHGQWTISHLGSEADAPAVLRAIIEGIPGKAPPEVGGVLIDSNEALMAAASEAADTLGATPEDAIRFAQQTMHGQKDIPTALKALQTIWARMGSDMAALTKGIDWNTAPEELVLKAGQQIHDLHLFGTAFQDTKAAAGRGLQVLGLPDADAYLSGLRRAIRDPSAPPPPTGAGNPPPLPRTRQELADWLSMWDALKDNPTGQQAFLKGIKTYPSGSLYLRTAFANFFTGAILSAPKTILLNVVQPAFVGGLRTLERTAGGLAASVVGHLPDLPAAARLARTSGSWASTINPLLSQEERRLARTTALQAPVTYLQTLGDIADAFRGAADAFTENKSILGGPNPLDFNSAGIPEPLIRAAQADGKLALPYHLGNLLNYLPRAVFRLHGTTNEVALHMAYKGEVRAQAYLEAATQKLSREDTKALVAQRLSESTDNATGAATDAATLDSAHRTTMVRSADPEFSPGRASFDRTVQSWRKNVPELRYVLPIFQVPANALGETLRRIPGAGFLLKESSQELSGALGAYRQAEAYGRMMLGAGALTSGAIMARQGMITGAGPQDAQDKALWLTTHQPFSLRVGDQWVSYEKLDPVGPLLAIAAGHYDTSVYHDTDRDTTMAAVGALAEYLKDKAALKGLSDLLNFGGSPSDATFGNRIVGGIARGFVPAFLQTPRTLLDPNSDVKRNPWDYIRDALPAVSLQLDPQRNLLGEPIHKPQDTLVENLLPITMDKVSSYAEEPVLDELDRLYEKTGYTPGALSPGAGAQAHFDYRDVKLENGYSLYNALMQARQTATIDGVTLKEALKSLIDSPEYASAVDGTGKVGDGAEAPREDTRGGMVQKVFTEYTAETKAMIARQSPTAARWMAVARIKADANDALRGTPAKDIVSNPKLLDALGISLDSYEAAIKGDPQ